MLGQCCAIEKAVQLLAVGGNEVNPSEGMTGHIRVDMGRRVYLLYLYEADKGSINELEGRKVDRGFVLGRKRMYGRVSLVNSR